jgi:hypothetical protein
MDGTADPHIRDASAVGNPHRHQQRIAGTETDAFASDFGDKLSLHDEYPFVLLVMQIQRGTHIRRVLAHGNNEGGESSLGIE